MEIQSFFENTKPAYFLLLNHIVSTFPALRMRQEDDFPAGTLIRNTFRSPMGGEREGGQLFVRKSIYPEPDGYLKMRVRDIFAGLIVVSCFALAVLLSNILPMIVRKTSRLSPVKLIRLARQNK